MIKADKDAASQLLQSFSCEKDRDIETFLQKRAIEFEDISKARTYLVCNEEAMIDGKFELLGYFSLALKVLLLPDDMSIRSRKTYDGFMGKIHGEPIREIPCYLIGQIARNDAFGKETISGDDLIEHAISVISSAHQSVGGRWVLVECRNNAKLISFYADNGFTPVMHQPDGDTQMVQLVRKL